MSNYDDMKSLIERISGQASVITVLRIYVDICGDLETAAVLSQCVFWSDKGTMREGWFYKSREEWHKEIGIKRTALEGAIKHLKEFGIVETDLKPAPKHNSPTLFYRVDMDALTQKVMEHLQIRFAEINKSNVRSVETCKSDVLKPANPSVDFNTSSYSSLLQNISSEDVQRIFHKDFDAACARLKAYYPADYSQAAPVLLEADERPYRLHVRLSVLPHDFIANLADALREVNPRRSYKITYQTAGTGRPAEQGEREQPDDAPDPYAPNEEQLMLWQSIISELSFDAKPNTYKAYIATALPISINGNWTIAVPSLEWWQHNMTSSVKRIYKKLTGEVAEFVFVEQH